MESRMAIVLFEYDVKGVIEIEAAHKGLMQLIGKAVIQIILGGVCSVAEVLGIGDHGRDQGSIHVVHHIALSATGCIDEEIILVICLGSESVMQHLHLLLYGHFKAHLIGSTDVGREGHEPLGIWKIVEELMPAGITSTREASKCAMVTGGNEACCIGGLGVGAIGALYKGKDFIWNLLCRKGSHVNGTGVVIVIVAGEYHDERIRYANLNHVVNGVLGLRIANEAVLSFIGAGEEVDDIVPLGSVLIVAVGQIDIYPCRLLVPVCGGGVIKPYDGTGLFRGLIVEFGIEFFEYGFSTDDIIRCHDLFVLGPFPAVGQTGKSGEKHHQCKKQNKTLFHDHFSFLSGKRTMGDYAVCFLALREERMARARNRTVSSPVPIWP